MKKEQTVTITLDKDMSFSVLLHRVWKKHPVNVDFLGIYVPPTNKFSPKAHGLIGTVFRDHLASGGPLGLEQLWRVELGQVPGAQRTGWGHALCLALDLHQ